MIAEYDLVIVGGGLAGGLMATYLQQTRPQLRFLLLEREGHLGGNHTWCFHERDLRPSSLEWVRPLVSQSWQRHEVRFPEYDRHFDSRYFALRSEDFHQRLMERLGDRVRLNTAVSHLQPRAVALEDRTLLQAHCVIDARGAVHDLIPGAVAWQKFFGMDLRLREPHGLQGPILKDVKCEQIGGYRFFYVLPWSANRVLIEDTCYSDTPDLDFDFCEREIKAYALRQGWDVVSVERTESGSLPLPLQEHFYSFVPTSVPRLGMSAGCFHSTTGYSLPDTVRLVEEIASIETLETVAVADVVQKYQSRWQTQQRYFRLLNRMLFRASRPEQRYRILARFYRLPEGLISRFYAGRLHWKDRVRILMGRPPVPLSAAMTCIREHDNRSLR